MSMDYDNPLLDHFGIKKIYKSVAQKYYYTTLQQKFQTYIKGYNIYLTSKTVHYNCYKDLQSFFLPTHCYKNQSIDFVTKLPVSTNQTSKSFDSILIIVNWFIKIVYYKIVKVIY